MTASVVPPIDYAEVVSWVEDQRQLAVRQAQAQERIATALETILERLDNGKTDTAS